MKAPLQPNKSFGSAASSAPAQRKGLKTIADNRPTAVAQRQMQQAVQRKQNRTGLPDKLKAGIEKASGYSLDDVRVHFNSPKPAQVNALAYAQGTDIYLAPGQQQHLPHEAWHVVQQKQGRVRPTIQVNGVGVNDNAGLEREADMMGRKALQMKGVTITRSKKTLSLNKINSLANKVSVIIQRKAMILVKDKKTNIPIEITGRPDFTSYVTKEMIRQYNELHKGEQGFVAKVHSNPKFKVDKQAQCHGTSWETIRNDFFNAFLKNEIDFTKFETSILSLFAKRANDDDTLVDDQVKAVKGHLKVVNDYIAQPLPKNLNSYCISISRLAVLSNSATPNLRVGHALPNSIIQGHTDANIIRRPASSAIGSSNQSEYTVSPQSKLKLASGQGQPLVKKSPGGTKRVFSSSVSGRRGVSIGRLSLDSQQHVLGNAHEKEEKVKKNASKNGNQPAQ